MDTNPDIEPNKGEKVILNGTDNTECVDSGRVDKQKEEEDEEKNEDDGKRLVDGEKGDGTINDKDKSNIGLDGGYAWFVVLACFIALCIGAGFMKSMGIFFLQFQERFQIGALQAAWPGALLSLLQNVSAPLVSAVCNRYSIRTSVMIGTTLIFVGLILNSIVDNSFYSLFFCHSLLQGLGFGFMLTPGLYIVSAYFEKRRGFAVSLASCGGGVGTFVIIPLVTFLFEFYGFQGCFLILSAILANGYVVGMLYRPLRTHQKYKMAMKKSKDQSLSSNDKDLEDGIYKDIPLNETATQFINGSNANTKKQTNHCENGNCHQSREDSSNNQPVVITKCPITNNSTSTSVTKTDMKKASRFCKTSCYTELKSCVKICFPIEHKQDDNRTKRRVFHFELLKDIFFLLHLLSTVLFTMVMKATFTFIPAFCVDIGLTKTDAALVLSILGAVDTFARLGIGYSLDLPRVKPFRTIFYISFLFGMSLTGLCIPFLNNFAPLVVVCSLFGVCSGSHLTQRSVVLVDLLGKNLLPSCMGLTKLFQSIGVVSGPLIYGAIRDATGSYKSAFYVGGGLSLLAGLSSTFSNLVFVKKHKAEEKEQQEVMVVIND